ncbi:hypothetical protein [Streptomyces spiralis]|uniref:hypothetical protein n=1 Tax=Streptomyces spiralis TaxID=66376 RepID=UPI00367A2AFE
MSTDQTRWLRLAYEAAVTKLARFEASFAAFPASHGSPCQAAGLLAHRERLQAAVDRAKRALDDATHDAD